FRGAEGRLLHVLYRLGYSIKIYPYLQRETSSSAPRLGLFQHAVNLCDDHIDRNFVVAASWNNNVRPPFAGLDEFEVHGLHGPRVLRDNLVQRSPPFKNVPPDPAEQAFIGVRIDEDPYIHQFAQLFVVENEDPLDDDDVGRMNDNLFPCSPVGGIVISRLTDGPPSPELADMARKEG